MISINLQDILCLLVIQDRLLKPITLLKTFPELVIVVGDLEVPIVVAAALDHITQGFFVDLDGLLLFENLEEVERLQLEYLRDEWVCFAVVVLDSIFQLGGQHQDVFWLRVVFYLPFYLSHLALECEEVQRSHGLILADGLRFVKLEVSEAVVTRVDVKR